MFRYYEGLQKCVGLYSETSQYVPEQIEQLDTLYKYLGQQYSWSSAVKVYVTSLDVLASNGNLLLIFENVSYKIMPIFEVETLVLCGVACKFMIPA